MKRISIYARRRIDNNVKNLIEIIKRIYKMIISTHRRILHYYNSEFEKGATDHSD